MKKICLWLSIVMVFTIFQAALVNAATEAEKQLAIEKALAWMAANQQPDGRWNYGETNGGDIAATGAALLAFMEQKDKSGGWFGIDYTPVVNKGYEYIMNHAQSVTIGPQTYGNPDINGNGIGVKFVLGGVNSRDTYVTGLVLPALIKRGNLNDVIAVGSQAGRTYKAVIQDTVDYFAWGQNENGYARGSWRYYANSGDADNSTAQWPVVGMLYAQTVPGITVPQFVKDELKLWIDYIQHPSGGSGYDSPSSYLNESKTGGLLLEMVFAGYDGYKAGDTLGKQEALNYLDNNWQSTPSGTWYGNFLHPYAMWGIYKGLQLTIGTGNTTEIANLHAPGPMDPGDAWNWWEDYCETLVRNQNANGSWTGYSYWGAVLATPWYVNILNATVIPKCDLTGDFKIDRTDINIIMTGRGLNKPGDVRDIDGDGWITVNDARSCVLQCTNPNCAP